MIAREIVEEILSRNDIETLIGGYVSLRRAGSNLKGLCPFHSEKTPSFTVFPGDNSFYCFGCGVGGNAITFVRQIEHLDYPDAVKFLGKRAGITVVDDNRDDRYTAKKFDRARMLKMNVDAAKFFNRCLFSDTKEAREALSYFTQARRLSLATIRHFGLGYAPNSYDLFMKHMLSLGYTKDELVAGFLLGKSERGTYYDAFRNRVMFPIIDVSGNVIAFGGRVMDDSKPKYKNSSDTPVFKKLRNLFALNFARHTCSEEMILCEGYMDVIALHSAGFTNAVATLGTAITEEQARLMSRYTKKVIICYDADEAGQKAAARALKMLGDVGLDVTVLKVPGAKDPDEYIKQNGADKFRSLLGASKTKFEYNMENILAKYDNISMPQERINALSELTKMIAEFYSAAERDIYIQAVSKKLTVDPASVKTDVERIMKANLRKFKKDESRKLRQSTEGIADKVNPDYVKAPAVAKNEEAVLGMLLLFEPHRKRVYEGALLSEEDFFTEFNRRVFSYIGRMYREGVDPASRLDEEFTPEEVGRITSMKLHRMRLTDNGDGVLDDMIANLRQGTARRTQTETSTYEELSRMISRMREEN